MRDQWIGDISIRLQPRADHVDVVVVATRAQADIVPDTLASNTRRFGGGYEIHWQDMDLQKAAILNLSFNAHEFLTPEEHLVI